MRRDRTLMLAVGLLLTLGIQPAASTANPGSKSLTNAQILEMGPDGYVTHCREQSRGRFKAFTDSHQLQAWSKYAACRRELNRKAVQRLPEGQRKLFRRAAKAVSNWEQAYLAFVWAGAGKGKPPVLLANWPEAELEDVLGDVLTVIKEVEILKPALTHHSFSVLGAARQRVDHWAREAEQRRVLQFDTPADPRRAAELARSEARVREDASRLEAVVSELPPQAQWYLCRHIARFILATHPLPSETSARRNVDQLSLDIPPPTR